MATQESRRFLAQRFAIPNPSALASRGSAASRSLPATSSFVSAGPNGTPGANVGMGKGSYPVRARPRRRVLCPQGKRLNLRIGRGHGRSSGVAVFPHHNTGNPSRGPGVWPARKKKKKKHQGRWAAISPVFSFCLERKNTMVLEKEDIEDETVGS